MRTKEALQTSPKSVRTGCARDLRGRTRSQAGRPPSSPLHLELASLARARAGAQSRTCWPQCVPRSEPSAGQGRVVVRLRGGETLEPLGPLSAASLSRRRPGVTRDAACHGACHGALGAQRRRALPPGRAGVVAAHLRVSRAPRRRTEALRWGRGRTYAASAGGGTKGWVFEGQHPGGRSADGPAARRKRRRGAHAGPAPRCWCEEIAGFHPAGSCQLGSM